ncbi:MAG: phosphoribosylformylglycinamidine synthase subunit PurS [Alphaproteobacteria bacterium GM202ARS2]|nr:phosphoribosylformylglycinamidine synthase subunit PurS [Alphaproteobacteria bacterium GM202ARS2]
MKAVIHIMPHSTLLDPQGRAIALALQEQGYPVADARQGKRIELHLSQPCDKATIETMCQELLVNGVIESYHIDMVD